MKGMEIKNELLAQVLAQVNRVVIGKEQIVAKLLAAMLAKGHVLLEDIPGVGKTTLAMSFARACEMSQKRMQFTPDVLPSDVTGYSMPNRATGQMEYQPGAVDCNLFLADEINRTSSKTQSALLEAMEERQVTVDGVTRKLPEPFMVIATQNPSGSAGTQRLPESQMDRFMICMSMGYPQPEQEVAILKARDGKKPLDEVETCMRKEDLIAMQREVSQIFLHDDLYVYIVDLVAATRNHPSVEVGISPRGTLALMDMAKAMAFLAGSDFVLPEDVQAIFLDVCVHRLVPAASTRMEQGAASRILTEILGRVKPPKLVH